MNVTFFKSPHGSVKMTIYFDITNLMGNYMVFNESKSPYKNSHSKWFFNLHVKKIKSEIHPKLIIMWTYENMVHFKPFESP